MKLTKAQMSYLQMLDKHSRPGSPWDARGPCRAMCNKLVRLGLAAERFGYPTGYYITDAGRAALSDDKGGYENEN